MFDAVGVQPMEATDGSADADSRLQELELLQKRFKRPDGHFLGIDSQGRIVCLFCNADVAGHIWGRPGESEICYDRKVEVRRYHDLTRN